MNKHTFILCACVLFLFLAGCTSVTAPPSTVVSDPESKPESKPESIPESIPERSNVEAVTKPPLLSNNRAVITLLNRARIDTDAGQREAASASLERALRIEPRNPWLWHELAQLRLRQGNYAQAISLAKKSSSFAGGSRQIQALNWRVIGNARIAQGNPAEAERAFKKAIELE